MRRLVLLACVSCTGAPPRPSPPPPQPPVGDAAPVVADAAVPVDAPPPIDAAIAVVDATTPVAVGCKSHYNMLPDATVLVGMTEAEVRCSIGEPRSIAGATWSYRLPRDCSEIEDDITVVFANGRVARASSKRRHTGKFCQ